MLSRWRSPLALVYHGVADVRLSDDPHALFVSDRSLRAHIRTLKRWGYRFSTFAGLAEQVAKDGGGGVVALTFDDGLADNLDALVPILEDERVPATVFVVSGWLGEEHPDALGARIMTAEEVRVLSQKGVEIGAHTVTHPDLTRLSFDEAIVEMKGSRVELTRIAGTDVTSLAYPYGHANEDVIRAAEAAGFRAACRVSGAGSWSEPLNLPRQDMANSSSYAGLLLKRHDLYRPLVGTLPGRALRRLRRRFLGAIRR
jgi:peptidoglycan/xylan/chitin deacetylase (PgdA/CDA1 family)